MGKVAIYARVSTITNQDYTRQVNELKAIILKAGYKEKDIKVYAESVSGYKREERLQLMELLKTIEANPKLYDCIYTSEISRIGRNPNHTRQIIDRWSELGVPLYIQSLGQSTISKDGKRNATMNIILQVLMEYANMEAETFKTRSRSGLRASAKEGMAGGGVSLAYGYARDKNGYLVIDKQEAAVISKIFDLYLKGNGIKVISGLLNVKRIKTRTNKTHSDKEIKFSTTPKLGKTVVWSDKQIHDILKNTLYKGERKFKGEILKAPAIISPQIFDRCTELRASKTHRNYLTKYIYLLKDMMVCARCGRNYFAKYKPVPQGDKVYICSSRLLPKGNCGNIGINITLIESVIYSLVFDNEIILKYLNDSSQLVQNLKNEIEQLTQKLPVEEKTKSEVINGLEKLEDLYLYSKGISIERYLKRKGEMENEVASITERIYLIEKQLADKRESLKKFEGRKASKQVLKRAKVNRTDLQAIYKQFITKITVDKLEPNDALIGVYMQINGVQLENPMQVLLDLHGVKRRPSMHRYKAIYTDLKPNTEGDLFDYSDFDSIDWVCIQTKDLIAI